MSLHSRLRKLEEESRKRGNGETKIIFVNSKEDADRKIKEHKEKYGEDGQLLIIYRWQDEDEKTDNEG